MIRQGGCLALCEQSCGWSLASSQQHRSSSSSLEHCGNLNLASQNCQPVPLDPQTCWTVTISSSSNLDSHAHPTLPYPASICRDCPPSSCSLMVGMEPQNHSQSRGIFLLECAWVVYASMFWTTSASCLAYQPPLQPLDGGLRRFFTFITDHVGPSAVELSLRGRTALLEAVNGSGGMSRLVARMVGECWRASPWVPLGVYSSPSQSCPDGVVLPLPSAPCPTFPWATLIQSSASQLLSCSSTVGSTPCEKFAIAA